MNHKQSVKLKVLIANYTLARVEYSWAGNYELEDQQTIIDNLKIETERLNAYLEELTNETK